MPMAQFNHFVLRVERFLLSVVCEIPPVPMVFIGDVLYRGEILDLSVENPDVSGDYTACPDSFYQGYSLLLNAVYRYIGMQAKSRFRGRSVY